MEIMRGKEVENQRLFYKEEERNRMEARKEHRFYVGFLENCSNPLEKERLIMQENTDS